MTPFKHALSRPCPALASALAGLLALAACGERAEPGGQGAAREAPAASVYLEPPRVEVIRMEGDRVILAGQAAPSARVRLATPAGEERFAEAGLDGAWRIDLPADEAARIFGLSMTAGGRTVQAEAYQLVLPDGRLVRLRAGAGAWVLDGQTAPGVTAFDFDEEGGAIVSGHAPPEAAFTARLDGRTAATNGRADAEGRFSLPFGAPVTPGVHRIEIQGDGFSMIAMVEATPAGPPESGAFRARRTAHGLRIDWLTPGGGVQSTLVLDRSRP